MSLDDRPVIDATLDAAPPRAGDSPARLRTRVSRHLWWLTPAGCIALVVPVSLIVALQIPDSDYRLLYKSPKVLAASSALLFLAAAAVFALGSLIPLAARLAPVRHDWPKLPAAQLRVLRKAERIAFWLTVLGYVLLGGLGVARGATPGVLLSTITSQDNYTGVLKTAFAPIAGVTSLTQVGIAYVIIAALLLCNGRDRRTVRRLVIVVALGLVRSFLVSERLALLELIVPLVAIGATNLRFRRRRTDWLALAPVFALPVLVVVFGAFEYSRSWQYYKTRTLQSFPQFVISRIAGYYATSYNNGVLQMQHNTVPGRLPYDSIQAFWTAPGIAQLDLYHRLTGMNGGDLLTSVSAQYGNPEFNNPGGLSIPLVDFGIAGGLLFFFAAGLAIGLGYRSYRVGNPVGLLVYPLMFTGTLEIPRYMYWTEGRVVPSVVALLITAWAMNRAARPKLRTSAAGDTRRVLLAYGHRAR